MRRLREPVVVLHLPAAEMSEQPPPNGEHDPADPEDEEDPGLAGGEHNGDKPEV